MSRPSACLNCESPVSGKFCPDCGQKTDTHRITFKHFVMHDILHGVWHFEKGILFTLKEAMFRPGQAAVDYINGKRIRYYNVFYLMLLLIGLGIFIDHQYITAKLKYVSYIEPDIESAEDSMVLEFISKYVKYIVLLALPLFSFTTYILFNKRKFNYSEHVIIFGMLYLGTIVITLIGNLFYFGEFVESLSFLFDVGFYFIPTVGLIYLINGFYGAFGKDYTFVQFCLRLLVFIVLIFVYMRLMALVLKLFLVHS